MSVRTLKAVTKGLAMLETLNANNGLTAMQLARKLEIPRSTVLRLLLSAKAAGFVHKDATQRYRVTRAVRRLALGPPGRRAHFV